MVSLASSIHAIHVAKMSSHHFGLITKVSGMVSVASVAGGQKRAGERPPAVFWLCFSGTAYSTSLHFTTSQSTNTKNIFNTSVKLSCIRYYGYQLLLQFDAIIVCFKACLNYGGNLQCRRRIQNACKLFIKKFLPLFYSTHILAQVRVSCNWFNLIVNSRT